MSKKINPTKAKLDLNALDKIVAGAGETQPRKATDTQQALAIADQPQKVDETPAPSATLEDLPVANRRPPAVALNAEQFAGKYAEQEAVIKSQVVDIFKTVDARDEQALGRAVSTEAARMAKMFGLEPADAQALSWSMAVKAVAESGALDGNAAGKAAFNGMMASHVNEIAKGYGVAVGIHGEVTKGMDAVTSLIGNLASRAPNPEAFVGLAVGAYAQGLEAARDTKLGAKVFAVIDDPKNVEAWKDIAAEVAVNQATNGLSKPVKFAVFLVEHGALAKALDVVGAPAEIQSAVKTMGVAVESMQEAFKDIYKTGYLGAIEVGANLMINAGKNCYELGKAIGSGDLNGIKDASIGLIKGVAEDYVEILRTYYVEGGTKAIEWTRSLVGSAMDAMGATPYAEAMAAATKDAMVDMANAAKDGSVAAINAIADFAKLGGPVAQQALDTMEGLAKGGGAVAKQAFDTLEGLGREGVGEAVDTLKDLAAVGGTVGADALHAIGDVALAGGQIGKAALDSLEDLGKKGLAPALVALGELGKVGGPVAGAAVEALSDVAKIGGKAGQAAIEKSRIRRQGGCGNRGRRAERARQGGRPGRGRCSGLPQ